MRRKPGALLLVAALALSVAGPALAGNGGVAPVQPASPNAGSIRDAYWLILAVTGAIFVIVETALVVFVVRFRRGRRAAAAEGAQIHGSTSLEIAWTVVPVLIIAAIIGFVFAKLPSIKNTPPASAADSVSIRVEGHQFYWLFRYPQGQVSIDTLEVPVGKVVTLTVVATDVVHSWWIPALGGQIDAIPGRTNHTWFRATRPGTYLGRCAQLCGLFHAEMKATVRAVSEREYRRFLASHAAGSRTVAEETFTGVCSKCHGFQGRGDYGPALQNRTFATADITDLLRHGRTTNLGHMPAVGSDWSQAQITGIIDYLRQTKGGARSGG